MRLVVFSENTVPNENEVQLVKELLAAGLWRYQVLKPSVTTPQLLAFLQSFSANEREKIVLTQPCIVHKITELSLEQASKYLFLSPIFRSISKPNYGPAWSSTDIARAIKLSTVDCFALGGVSAENLQQVVDFGFKGAGLLGAIWQSKDPVAEFVRIQSVASLAYRSEQQQCLQ